MDSKRSTKVRFENEIPELLWRAQISGMLRDLTREVLALTDVVLAINEKLAALEHNQESRDDG